MCVFNISKIQMQAVKKGRFSTLCIFEFNGDIKAAKVANGI